MICAKTFCPQRGLEIAKTHCVPCLQDEIERLRAENAELKSLVLKAAQHAMDHGVIRIVDDAVQQKAGDAK